MSDEATEPTTTTEIEAPRPSVYASPEIQEERDAAVALWNLMRQLAGTEWGKPFDHKPEKMLAAALQGRALNVDAMTSLREIGIINGKPFLSAELRLGLARRAGHIVDVEAYPDKATAHGRRIDTSEELTVTYTLDEAVTEGIVSLDPNGKPLARSRDGKPLPWERYTSNMLLAGAVRRLCDRLFPDVMIGQAL